MNTELPNNRALARAAIGFLQGIALYCLNRLGQAKIWPATDRMIFTPLVIVALFVPLILLFGIGSLKRRTLLIWTAGAMLALIGLALHDAARAIPVTAAISRLYIRFSGSAPIIGGPSLLLVAFTALGLFIAQSLVTAGDADRRFFAHYPKYFDAAWKLELQLLLAVLFVGLFWILLYLGTALLMLVKVAFLQKLIRHAWFSIPVTTLALAVAIHLTDVRSNIISGMRSLIHIVLSWLLPMIAAIVGIFLVCLPFTGLDPLWRTSHAGALLLSVAGTLIILINAIYRDGDVEQASPKILRFAGSLAAIELVPIVGIAALAIGLRVEQYGWDVARVYATAAATVAAFYAAGYAFAVMRRGPWLKRLEGCNLLTSFVILAALIVLLTPVGDPARISVGSQIALLKAGKISPDRFDYAYLRWHGERYGNEALKGLASDTGNADTIKEAANRALSAISPYAPNLMAPTQGELAAAITVYPVGRTLPLSFLQQKWPVETQFARPVCFYNKAVQCDAFLADLDGDGVDEIIIMQTPRAFNAAVFKQGADGNWALAGYMNGGGIGCSDVHNALRAGQFTLAPTPWKVLNVVGKTFTLAPVVPVMPRCQ